MMRIFVPWLAASFITQLLANPADQPATDSGKILRVVVDENRRTTVNGMPVEHYPDLKPIFVSMPKPDYPLELRRMHLTGSGIFRMYIDEHGTVEAIKVRKSTGHSELDAQVVKDFGRWRAKAGPRREIDIPITFSMTSKYPPRPPLSPPPGRGKIRVLHDT
jgi:TonB family protein